MRKSSRYETFTGTLGGVAEYSGLDYTWLRISFVMLVLISKGWLALLYIILMLIMPKPKIKYASQTSFLKLSARATAVYFYNHLKMVLKKYRGIFGSLFLVLGFLWLGNPMTTLVAFLLLAGAILFFDPFGLTRRRQKWLPIHSAAYRPGQIYKSGAPNPRPN